MCYTREFETWEARQGEAAADQRLATANLFSCSLMSRSPWQQQQPSASLYTSQVRGGSVRSSSETLQAGLFLPKQNEQHVYRLNQLRNKMRTCCAPCVLRLSLIRSSKQVTSLCSLRLRPASNFLFWPPTMRETRIGFKSRILLCN